LNPIPNSFGFDFDFDFEPLPDPELPLPEFSENLTQSTIDPRILGISNTLGTGLRAASCIKLSRVVILHPPPFHPCKKIEVKCLCTIHLLDSRRLLVNQRETIATSSKESHQVYKAL
jgi:hypothetical protein